MKYTEKKKIIIDILTEFGFKESLSSNGNQKLFWFKIDHGNFRSKEAFIMFEGSPYNMITFNLSNMQFDITNSNPNNILTDIFNMCENYNQSWLYHTSTNNSIIRQYEDGVSSLQRKIRDLKIEQLF